MRTYYRMPRGEDDPEELAKEEWLRLVDGNYPGHAEAIAESGDEVYSQFYVYWTEETE